MAAPDRLRPDPIRPRHWPAMLAIGVAVGCASNEPPEALPPQTLAEFEATAEEEYGVEPSAVAEPAAEPAEPAPEPVQGTQPIGVEPVSAEDLGEPHYRSTTVIESEEPKTEPGTDLLAAAQEARRQREAGGRAKFVVTDKNLSDFADVPMTTAEPAPATGERPAGEGGSPPASETYWRDRMLTLRLAWREAYDRVAELELEVGRLRQEFYTVDDPFVRDGQIRPAWDRALGQLRETEASLEGLEAAVNEALDEGRRTGALPGWLREGVDLEPPPPQAPPPIPTIEPGEPEIVDEDSGR